VKIGWKLFCASLKLNRHKPSLRFSVHDAWGSIRILPITSVVVVVMMIMMIIIIIIIIIKLIRHLECGASPVVLAPLTYTK
jgi:hypothetical protein